VFSYYLRHGTEAAGLDGQVAPQVIKERTRRLRELDGELRRRFATSLIGRTQTILSLQHDGTTATAGLTGTFVKARLAGVLGVNELIEARVTRASAGEILAEPIVHDALERACS